MENHNNHGNKNHHNHSNDNNHNDHVKKECCGGCGCSNDAGKHDGMNNGHAHHGDKYNDHKHSGGCCGNGHNHSHTNHMDDKNESCSYDENDFDCLSQEEQILHLKSDVKSLTDKLMRALAEIQNAKRISDKEKSDIHKYGISKFAKDILVVRDTLKLALANADESNPIVVGVKQVLGIFDKTIENYGVSIIDTNGAKFDPNYHQAMMEVESSKGQGEIVDVIQDGFMIGDRLLRPAMVTVSKGGQ